jgi:hypothetical protein
MAHRGKDWPVLFRRDFNLNVQTYRHGLAEKYHVQIPQFVFPDYPELRNTDWICGTGLYDPPDRIAWNSPLTVLSGRTWQVQMHGTLSGAGLALFTPTWQLWLNGALTITYELRAADHTTDIPISGAAGHVSFIDASKFPSGPGSVGTVTVFPLRYP